MDCIFKVRIRLCHSYKYGGNRTRTNEATRHNNLDVYQGNVSAHMRLGGQWCGRDVSEVPS